MSQSKASFEDRYSAVMELQNGASLHSVQNKYHITRVTLKALVRRYEKQGVSGLQNNPSTHYSDAYILSVIAEYETKGLSLDELSAQYDVAKSTVQRWLSKYELYKAGDKFAFNGGRVFKADGPAVEYNPPKPPSMMETKERAERRKALSKLSKKELYELLMDREAELELIKKAEALVNERESRLRAIGRKSSKD